MDIRGKNFLLIGGAGLIGSHTLDQLLKEDVAKVTIFDNFTRGSFKNIEEAMKDSRVKIFEHGGDINQIDILEKSMQNIDGVFHFAALWLLHCWDYPRSAFKTNIEGTFNVLEACIKSKIKKLIYSSSASVYGDAVEDPMTENHPFNNTNFYGASKIAGEQMAKAYHHRFGLNYLGLRYMNVYGPRQDYKGAYIAVIMKILDNLSLNKSPVLYGDGKQAYDFISVKDCASANICAMKSEKQNEFYNVGTGIKTSLLELTNIILEEYGSDLKIEFKEEGNTFVKNRVGDPTKAKKEIGFKYKIDLRKGIKDLIEWRKSIS